MPRRRSHTTVPKRAANVSVRSDLLTAAKATGINLSATLELALERELAAAAGTQWRRENREAIESYNEQVEEHGSFADDMRTF